MSANHILQIFLSAENFPERKWAFKTRLEKVFNVPRILNLPFQMFLNSAE